MVRALDLLSGDGFGSRRFNSSTLLNSQLASLSPVGIFNQFLFNLQYLFVYFSVRN